MIICEMLFSKAVTWNLTEKPGNEICCSGVKSNVEMLKQIRMTSVQMVKLNADRQRWYSIWHSGPGFQSS
ncbi:MAG TPA: hypothetical protein DHW39_06170 [Erysipelotrichaceae bacterium]|nr:hypothetical protein [Erysipelotrichaceae bacterium]